jgi:hypothetical protein
VRSQHFDDITYTVAAGGCPCVDAQRHPNQSCKHVWAVELLQVTEEHERRLAERQSEEAARAAVAADAVVLANAHVIGFGRAA